MFAVPTNILCPLEPVTYPLSAKVTVVKVVPPSLEILAIKSVFNVILSMFSWKTTIRLDVGALAAVNALDTIAVVAVTSVVYVPVSKTYPSSPTLVEPIAPGESPSALPSFVEAT